MKDIAIVLAMAISFGLGYCAHEANNQPTSREETVNSNVASRTVFVDSDAVFDDSDEVANRDGKFVWFVIESIVTDGDAGVGYQLNKFGFKTDEMMYFDKGAFKTGDVVMSYCLLNPASDWNDDVIDRFDVLREVYE